MSNQDALPGVMTEHPEIEKAASTYVEARDARMALTKDEVAAREVLIQAMKTAGVLTYRTTDGLTCLLTTKEKVKVRSGRGEDEVEVEEE